MLQRMLIKTGKNCSLESIACSHLYKLSTPALSSTRKLSFKKIFKVIIINYHLNVSILRIDSLSKIDLRLYDHAYL